MERDQTVGDTLAGRYAGFPITVSGTLDVRFRQQMHVVALTLDRGIGPCVVLVSPQTLPATVIRRLEDFVEGMAMELADARERLASAERAFADYLPRLGTAFPLQAVLDAKRDDLAALDRDLAKGEADAA